MAHGSLPSDAYGRMNSLQRGNDGPISCFVVRARAIFECISRSRFQASMRDPSGSVKNRGWMCNGRSSANCAKDSKGKFTLGRWNISGAPRHGRARHLDRSDAHADRLGLEIIPEHLASHLAAPARLLVAAKGHRRVENVVAIDPDRPSPQLIGDAMRTLDVGGPEPRGQAVHRVVG